MNYTFNKNGKAIPVEEICNLYELMSAKMFAELGLSREAGLSVIGTIFIYFCKCAGLSDKKIHEVIDLCIKAPPMGKAREQPKGQGIRN